ncbi:MAG: hypothetical protein KF795_13790 [Labilithrix sp.]|nr:hypothetical protein [Labilithrix sp.]
MKRAEVHRAITIVERLGIALVYPIDNKAEPRSLWSELYPGTRMEWSWDADADPRVAEVWHLRERLARSNDVAYAKWFRGRATFFALPVFHALLGRLAAAGDVFAGLPPEALAILDLLRERSPLSTKELRALADLRGKEHEALFNRVMKALWTRLLVVGTGEVEDGAFPSLAVGATELLFEDVVNAARLGVPASAAAELDAVLARSPAYARELDRALAEISTDTPKKRAPGKGSPGRSRPAKKRITRRDPRDVPFSEPSPSEVFGEDR